MVGYSNTSTVAPTPGELVARLNELKDQRQVCYEEGLRLDEEIRQAEKAIHEAVAFLRSAIDGETKRAI